MARQVILFTTILASAFLVASGLEDELQRKPSNQTPQQQDQQQTIPPNADNSVPVVSPDGESKNDLAPVSPTQDSNEPLVPLFDLFGPRPRPYQHQNRRPSLFDLLDGGIFSALESQSRMIEDQFKSMQQEAIEGKSTVHLKKYDDQGILRSYTRTCVTTRDN